MNMKNSEKKSENISGTISEMISRVVENKVIAPDISDIFEMELHAPELSGCKPGQFVMVYLDKGEHLLPRPISICRYENESKSVFLVYKKVGAGTEYMTTLKPGAFLRLMGPLGNGYAIKNSYVIKSEESKADMKIALVGGGVGIPPLVQLYKELKLSGLESADIFLGFRDKPFLTEHFAGANLYTTTGNLIDLVKQHESDHKPNHESDHKSNHESDHKSNHESDHKQGRNYSEIYACGPKPMLAALAQYAKEKGITLQVSLEERMACGIGVCLGCVAPTADHPPGYLKICCDGPVFYSDKVDL